MYRWWNRDLLFCNPIFTFNLVGCGLSNKSWSVMHQNLSDVILAGDCPSTHLVSLLCCRCGGHIVEVHRIDALETGWCWSEIQQNLWDSVARTSNISDSDWQRQQSLVAATLPQLDLMSRHVWVSTDRQLLPSFCLIGFGSTFAEFSTRCTFSCTAALRWHYDDVVELPKCGWD